MSEAQVRPLSLRVPCACGASVALEVDPAVGTPASARCAACGEERALTPGRLDADGGLWACQACGHPELFTKKDLPQAVGIAVVVVAAVLAPFTHYLSLAVAALIDLGLYFVMSEVVMCYVCGAEHRRGAARPRHPRYDREIAERLAYGKRAVMGKPMRAGGTADAPEPEH
ncbi:MAG: hypothetical protein H6828_06155 [Planctomycetes bacterium]|nr:hypothetical protein [Planctomycetota bacterium]